VFVTHSLVLHPRWNRPAADQTQCRQFLFTRDALTRDSKPHSSNIHNDAAASNVVRVIYYILAFASPAIALVLFAFACPRLQPQWLADLARLACLVLGALMGVFFAIQFDRKSHG
jgi:hypothetical protein